MANNEIKKIKIGETTYDIVDDSAARASDVTTHVNNTSNPHSVTKAQVGLGNVVNTGDSATPVSGGTTKFTTGGAYTELNKKVDKVTGKDLSTNDYTTSEKNKLAGIATGAEVNQNAFSNIVVGDKTIAADSKTDTVTFVAGSNITLTADTTNDKVTITATADTNTAHTHSVGTGLTKTGNGGISGDVKYEITSANASEIMNLLSEGTSTPTDADYYISQYVAGGTTTTTYHRRPMSALWTYIKGKGDSTYLGKSAKAADADKLDGQDSAYYLNYNNLTNKPTIDNNNQTVKGNGTAFGANTAVNIVGGSNVSVTADTTNNKITIAATDTNTHYTSKNIVGASATATANATAANGNVYLNHLEESTVKSSHKIVGSGATTVTSDSNGNITISSTDNNTTYSAGTGLSLSGTTFNHSNSVTAKTTAGFNKHTYDAQGHITGSTAVTKADITGLGIPGSDTNTHRPIQMNGTEILGNNTTALNLKQGNGISLSNSSGTVTIAADLPNVVNFIGVTTTAISDGSTTNPITISGTSVTAKHGDLVLYGSAEFLWNDKASTACWEILGDESAYAHKNVATGGATPATDSQGGHTHSVTINTYTATGATTVTGVSGSTTASKATAGTARKIGNANVGTAVACDDITAWTTNTPTSASVSGTCLVINTGTEASLSYTARSIAPATTSSDTITPYTFADVTVPKAATSATNVISGISAGTASATTDTKGAHTHTVNSHTHTQQ